MLSAAVQSVKTASPDKTWDRVGCSLDPWPVTSWNYSGLFLQMKYGYIIPKGHEVKPK